LLRWRGETVVKHREKDKNNRRIILDSERLNRETNFGKRERWKEKKKNNKARLQQRVRDRKTDRQHSVT
jgi:hypothetical protein